MTFPRKVKTRPTFWSACLVAPVLAGFLGFAVGASAQGTEEETIPVIMPPDLDPNGDSGWMRIELAVLIDDRDSVLTSERWPPFPRVDYPTAYRWLLDPDKVEALGARYPFASAEQNETGRITIKIPSPQALIDEALKAQAEEEAALAASLDPLSDSDPGPAPPSEQVSPEPVPLELIDEAATDTRASVEWLGEFEAEEQPESDADAALSPGVPPELEPPEPALPVAFQRRPLEMMAAGIARLTRNNPDREAVSLAWLQPPGARNLPIILDDSGDASTWPAVQGFVELRRGEPTRLGVNVWLNTEGDYLPEAFALGDTPPRGPAQISLADRDTQLPLTTAEAQTRTEQLLDFDRQRRAGQPITEFVDPNTGYYRDNAAQPVTAEPIESATLEWPFRHLLHVADTRALPEAQIRYFDHPVIKVIATWRELSWGEVYLQGERDRKAAEARAARQTVDDSNYPASVVPPRLDTRR